MKDVTVLNPIFDFQILCDIDLGLYRLIKRDYYDRNVFDNNLFDTKDERFIKTLLLSRKNFNPLIIFCKKNIMSDEELDDLYEQFLNEEYENIIALSSPTSLFDVATISNGIKNVVNITVLCKNQIEVNWINKNNKKLKCIISDYKDFSIDKFDTIYIKYIYHLLLMDQESIYMKNIIIPRYFFNLENVSRKIEMPIMEVAQNYYKINRFITVDVYKDIFVPLDEMD